MARARGTKAASRYGIHPGVLMMQTWVAELREKTGRSVDEWVALTKAEGPKGEKERREWLKAKHRLGTNSAWWLAERAEGKGDKDSSPKAYLAAAALYVEDQYSGPRKALRPIFEALLDLGLGLGAEVKACPCKTIVPLYREHVFAQIKPATTSRVDLGLALAGHSGCVPKRLVDTGGLAKKDRITHRIEVRAVSEVDAELANWLKSAYRLDA
jgi:hypothetical protein